MLKFETGWKPVLPHLLPSERPAHGFLSGVAGLVGKHSFFCAARAFALLAANFFPKRALGSGLLFAHGLEFVQQKFAGDETIEPLLTSFLTFDLHAGWSVQQHDASGSLVHI